VIEEFEPGEGTYAYGGEVRSLRLGELVLDLRERRVNVKPVREMDRVPRVGDKVQGVVQSGQGNIINLEIQVINDKFSREGFTGMLQARTPGPRRTTICKPGDILRARVVSNLNSIIHLAMDRSDEGVVCTVCSVCGGRVVRIRNRVKCIECGNIEDRMLASDFDGSCKS